MALILIIAFVAVTALALPNPSNPILSRDFPQPLGYPTGGPFDGLTFTIYAKQHCDGQPAGIYTGSYGFYEAYQMQSYSLSRELLDNEVLDFYTGLGTGESRYAVDHTKDGHYTEACLLYDVTAGINATTQDVFNKDGLYEGCHTLKNSEWCAVIWLKNSPQ